jgi:hypothetical protein
MTGFSFAMNFALMSLIDSGLGVGTFLIFYVGPSFVTLTILFMWLPETRRKEIHQIVEELQRGRKRRGVVGEASE